MSKPSCDDPAANFVGNLLVDISDEFKAFLIGQKLKKCPIPTYENNKPKNSLNSISDDFYNCIEPKLGDAASITATQLGDTILYITILTAVFMVLIVVVLELIDKKQQPQLAIALILFFALIYIIVGWLLIHNSFLIISNEITEIEKVTDTCVINLITDVETYFTNQETAINKALGSYPEGFILPPVCSNCG